VRTWGNNVIRQAISCDICGSEKKQTNHWFVAYDQGGELRVSGWNSRNRLRPGSKHLCGQTCLHKLVDDFMAKALAVRPQASEEAEVQVTQASRAASIDTSLTSNAAYSSPTSYASNTAYTSHDSHASVEVYDDFESSARLIPTPPSKMKPAAVQTPAPIPAPAAVLPKYPVMRPPVELVPAQPRVQVEEPLSIPEETPRYASRNWRAEAWERERDREQRPAGRHAEIAVRRRSNS